MWLNHCGETKTNRPERDGNGAIFIIFTFILFSSGIRIVIIVFEIKRFFSKTDNDTIHSSLAITKNQFKTGSTLLFIVFLVYFQQNRSPNNESKDNENEEEEIETMCSHFNRKER